MVRKRDLREEERELWEHVTRDVRKARATRGEGAAKPSVRIKVREPRPVALPPAPAKRALPAFGVDGGTAEKLRRGKVEPEAVLDLHGMTQAQAHARLVSFVRRGQEIGNRCLLVITGKGAPRPRDEAVGFSMPERSKAGVLRLLVPRWLEEPDMRAVVVGVQTAHQRHGGAGAFYVYLRRRR